jgi:hypothetical protein
MQNPGEDATVIYNMTASLNDGSNATAVQELTAVFNAFASKINGVEQAAFTASLTGDGTTDVLSAGGCRIAAADCVAL